MTRSIAERNQDSGARARRHGAVVAALVAPALAGCIADLPEPEPEPPPSDCVDPEPRGGGECPAFQGTPTMEGRCLLYEELACLAGPQGCAPCKPGECDSACASTRCPDALTAAVGDGATCLTPAITSIQCTCGCVSCAVACDGAGPVVGMWDNSQGEPNFIPFLVSLRNKIPESGRLGVFLRSRGRAHAAVYTFSADFGRSEFYDVQSSPTGQEFTDQVFGDPLYTWGPGEAAPDAIVLVQAPGDPGSILEIDCIVPFLLP